MTYVNGATSHEPSPQSAALAPDRPATNNQVVSMSPERLAENPRITQRAV